MEIEYGDSRRLSHGVIKYLNNYKVNENKRALYVNFILQVYQCVPLLNTNYYSCSLFDDESICKAFIVKYNSNEGRPYEGDIISITKIIINILNEKDNRIYCCEETKLLEKSAKYLVDPNNLINIASKKKEIIQSKNKENLDKNENNKKIIKDKEDKNIKEEKIKNIKNNNNTHKEMKKEIKNEKIIEKNEIDLDNLETDIANNIIFDKKEDNINKDKSSLKEINKQINDNKINYNKINKDENNLKEINEKINDNKINDYKINNINNINNKLTPLDKNKVNLIKIEPKKLDESLKIKDKEILESINLFIDDFEDGKNILSAEENHSGTPSINFEIINKIKENKEEKEINLKGNKKSRNNSKDYKNNNIIKRIPKNKYSKWIDNIKIMYIDDLKEVLKNYRYKRADFKVKIKCRIKTIFHSYNNFYVGCSNCYRKKRNNITCCKNRKEDLFYYFYVNVRDASGVVNVFFFNEIGKKLMNMSAKEYKELLDNNNEPMGHIMLSSLNNYLYENEYLFTLEFWEPSRADDIKKKYKVIEVEIINKKHKYELVKELKNILKINC